MATFICRFDDAQTNKSYYLEWSTISDSPVTHGMGLKEFTQYYRSEYGNDAMAAFHERMARVEKTGTSSKIHESLADLIICNRAGAEESGMTYEEILRAYCLEKPYR